MTTDSISVNIWDDYHDDDFVPEGEIQETYAYIECELEDADCKNVLEFLKKNIEDLANPEWNLVLSMKYYDAAEVYPNLVGTEHEWSLSKYWQLDIKHLTHTNREYLVEALKAKKLKYGEVPLEIYSES